MYFRPNAVYIDSFIIYLSLHGKMNIFYVRCCFKFCDYTLNPRTNKMLYNSILFNNHAYHSNIYNFLLLITRLLSDSRF